jgi:serine/threonine protein kinase
MGATSPPHPTDQTLQSYGLGKLGEGPAEAVNKHLEDCPDCRSRVAELSSDSFLGRLRDARGGTDKSTSGQSQPGGTQSYKGSKSPPPPPADTLPPGLVDHPDYEIKRELGRGGMGVVYLAHNTLMGRDEVLKVMGRQIMERPGVLERFVREIRAVAKLRHPNIVAAYSAFRLGESIVFAMEFVEGLDLSKMVKAKGPLPVGHACNFVYQSALGLQHAHEEGLVHRDIKPGNLMLARKGEKATVKVLDFGLAKVTREEKVDGGLTSVGQALGTPDYIAPEQILDAQSADVRADIYSLGGTLYYLLTGRPPFKANSLYDIYQAHISRDADPLNLVRPEVPAELAALVAKMMAKDPARRFQTPGEVAQALTPFFKKGSVAFKSPKAEVSQDGQTSGGRPVKGQISTPTRLAADSGGPIVRPQKATEPTVPDGRWESLIDFRDSDSSIEATPAVTPTRRPPWMWPSVAVGVLMFGLLAAWVGGGFKDNTPDGVIVLENVPKDAEIFLDGSKFTPSSPGIGKPVDIRVAPGPHKIEVKKDGFSPFETELTVEGNGSEEITVRLKPLVVDRPGKKEGQAPEARSDGDRDPTVPLTEKMTNTESGHDQSLMKRVGDSALPIAGERSGGEQLARPRVSAGVDLKRLKSRPGELRLLDKGAVLPRGPFWPEISPENVRGWRIGDPAAIKMNAEGILLSAGSGGNFLITDNDRYRYCSLVLSLEAAEGTEAYLVLRAHEGADGWRAVTSRIDVAEGKVRVGHEALDFRVEENGAARRLEYATGTLIPMKFELNDKGFGLVFVRGKTTASENLSAGPAVEWSGAAGVFVRTGSLVIHKLEVR